jgi:hypothetical protein
MGRLFLDIYCNYGTYSVSREKGLIFRVVMLKNVKNITNSADLCEEIKAITEGVQGDLEYPGG